MSFNVGNFVKNTSKDILKRVFDQVVNNTVSGMPRNTELISRSTAESLFNVGASYENIEATAAKRTDNLVSGAADAYYAFGGKNPSRISGTTVSNLRSSLSTNDYLLTSNPATKIAAKREARNTTIITVNN